MYSPASRHGAPTLPPGRDVLPACSIFRPVAPPPPRQWLPEWLEELHAELRIAPQETSATGAAHHRPQPALLPAFPYSRPIDSANSRGRATRHAHRQPYRSISPAEAQHQQQPRLPHTARQSGGAAAPSPYPTTTHALHENTHRTTHAGPAPPDWPTPALNWRPLSVRDWLSAAVNSTRSPLPPRTCS